MSYVSVGFTFKNKVKLVVNVPTAAQLATSLESLKALLSVTPRLDAIGMS